MRKIRLMKKAANSFAGRALRRLLGEEKGLVMMEYIIVGLLIAAVAVVAVAAFGNYASELFGVIGSAMGGKSTVARAQLDAADKKHDKNRDTAKDHATRTQDPEMEHAAVIKGERGTNK